MFTWAILKPIYRTIFKEFITTLLILFIISIAIFTLIYFSPNEDMLQEYMSMITEQLGMNTDWNINQVSFLSTFYLWLTAVFSGHFGLSMSNGMPAFSQSLAFLSNSLSLISLSFVFSLLIGLPYAYLILNKQENYLQKSSSFLMVASSFLPIFWTAYVVIYLSGAYLNYFPLSETEGSSSMVNTLLQVLLLSLGSGLIIEIAHHVSQEVKTVLQEDYILCARAKGASIFKHVFKEGIAFPILNLLSNKIAYLFGATIIIEQIFNWPGIGRLLWQATQDRDIPLLLSAVLLTVIVIRFAQFLSRVIYIIINPRASHE